MRLQLPVIHRINLFACLLLAVTSLWAELPPDRSALRPLPFGSVKAKGWMRTLLERNRDGMGGHFGSFDPDQFEKPFITRDYDAYLPGAGKDKPGWCAEMSGEFQLSKIELAVALGDDRLLRESRNWVESVLALQESDGYLGAYRKGDDRMEDYNAWGAHFAYRALLLEYSRTGDKRILSAVHRGLLWFVREWAGTKKTDYAGPTIIWPMVVVYGLTGDERLRRFCEDYAKVLNDQAVWNPHRCDYPPQTGSFSEFSLERGAYHMVAYAVRAQLPGVLSLANGDQNLLMASVRAYERHVDRVGWQATYAPRSQMEHTAPPSCVGETEYCNFICWMEYLQWLSRLTGESRFGDMVERICFNAAMGARKKDERAIAYDTSPNQFNATKTSAAEACMKYYEAYTPCLFAACCPAQSIRLIPSYLLKAVMRTRNEDLAVNAYGPYSVTTEACMIESETDYPFEHEIRFHVKSTCRWQGAIRLRCPDWADSFAVVRNGLPLDVRNESGWIAVPGPWKDDRLVVSFAARPKISAAPDENFTEPLRRFEYGPLVFAQEIKTKWSAAQDEPTARPLPPGWTWYEARPAGEVPLFAVPAELAFTANKIEVRRELVHGYPWENPPVRLAVPLVRASSAYSAHPGRDGMNPPPVANPVDRDVDITPEVVELVPYGATTLRLTCFPVAR